jgi:hypothetical protein
MKVYRRQERTAGPPPLDAHIVPPGGKTSGRDLSAFGRLLSPGQKSSGRFSVRAQDSSSTGETISGSLLAGEFTLALIGQAVI